MTTLQNISNLPNTSRDDPNNSGTYNKFNLSPKFNIKGVFTGISTNTNGFNSLIVNISTDVYSKACGLLIQFSDTGTDFDSNGTINYSTVYYSDTVLSSNFGNTIEITESKFFIKSYPILKKYYRISYTAITQPNILIISSRLSTDNYNSNINSINTFTNQEENIVDALGKLRVSYPKTLIDINFPTGITGSTGFNVNYLEVCQGYSGSSGYTGLTYANYGLKLSITGKVNAVSQSRKYSIYQPGKSLLFVGSGIIQYNNNFISGPYGYVTKIGYFDNYNGCYFGFDGNIFVAIKNFEFYQRNWNIDKMDGTGPSGITLDFSKMQIFVIDMEWSNTGRIRFGFYLLGKIIYCHRINRLNNDINNDINIPLNLPIRYEIVGLEGCTGNASLTQMSATVISEGGYNPTGNLFSFTWISTGSTSEKPLFALRGGGNNYYHQNIIPTQLSLGSSNCSDIFIYKMRHFLNPNDAPISNLAVWNTPDNFPNYGSLSVTEGTTGFSTPYNWNNSIILDTAVICGSKIIKYDNKNTNMEITADVNNKSSIIVITIENTTNTIYGTITWKEIY
jgi:hypothetical protein